MRNRSAYSIAVFWLISLAACGDNFSAAPQPTVAPSTGRISGSLPSALERWPGETVTIFAAPYLGGGTYILDPLNHPQAILDEEGDFTLINLVPGEYVLIAGPSAEQGTPVLDDAGELLILVVSTGSILPVYNLTIH